MAFVLLAYNFIIIDPLLLSFDLWESCRTQDHSWWEGEIPQAQAQLCQVSCIDPHTSSWERKFLECRTFLFTFGSFAAPHATCGKSIMLWSHRSRSHISQQNEANAHTWTDAFFSCICHGAIKPEHGSEHGGSSQMAEQEFH